MTTILIFIVLLLVFGFYAVGSRSILRSAIGLALASACLAMIFYLLGAELSSVFELSVCSGLVTVVFIAGISLSHSPKMELQNQYRDKERNRHLPLLLIGGGVVMIAAALLIGGPGLMFAPEAGNDPRELLWTTRQVDIWGQMAAILCGGVAVAVLFREEKRDQ